MSHITATYSVLGDDLENDSVNELSNDWAIKSPLPPARPTPLPVPHLSQTLIDCLMARRPLLLLVDVRPPPSPNHPEHGPPPPHHPPNTIPPRQYSPFEGLLFEIRQRAAEVSLQSGTPLPIRGVSPRSSPRVFGEVSLYLHGEVSLYCPSPRFARRVFLHSPVEQEDNRRTTRHIPVKSTKPSRHEDQASHHPLVLLSPVFTRIVRRKPVLPATVPSPPLFVHRVTLHELAGLTPTPNPSLHSRTARLLQWQRSTKASM